VILRRGGTQDVPFMRDMLRHAYYWRADEAFEDEEPLSRYVNGWGRAGDAALVAIQGANPVGAAWYRLFTREHPGFGYVDDETPELAIAVVPNRRGGGMGSTLLDALVDRAREEGYGQISLSVEAGSPAVGLYERHGFAKVAESDHSWTMLSRL
jgi:ribosomal protein S18 acetylase RimI-like enzyme